MTFPSGNGEPPGDAAAEELRAGLRRTRKEWQPRYSD